MNIKPLEYPQDIMRRLGNFAIDSGELEDNPGHFSTILQHAIIIRCEHEYASTRFIYTAAHPLFDPIDSYTIPPNYIFVATIERVDGEAEITKLEATRDDSWELRKSSRVRNSFDE